MPKFILFGKAFLLLICDKATYPLLFPSDLIVNFINEYESTFCCIVK